MTTALKSALLIAFVAASACSGADTQNNQAEAESISVSNATATETAAANEAGAPSNVTTRGAETPQADATAAPNADGSILAWSRPAAGSTVSGPVNELQLHFTPPARLGEVTVTGPEGAMPMMVTAVGEVEHYSLPLSGLGSGSYTVDWRAIRAGREYRGTFGFTVR